MSLGDGDIGGLDSGPAVFEGVASKPKTSTAAAPPNKSAPPTNKLDQKLAFSFDDEKPKLPVKGAAAAPTSNNAHFDNSVEEISVEEDQNDYR